MQWQQELEAEQGEGAFITIRIASSLGLLNPATFALLNLGEYEKHSQRTEVGEGQAGFSPPLTPCQVLCNSKSMSGMPPKLHSNGPDPANLEIQCLNPLESASELDYFKKTELGFLK